MRHIHILNRIFDLAWLNKVKLTLEQKYMVSVVHSQYHALWCCGDFRQGIYPQSKSIPLSASEGLKMKKSARVYHVAVTAYHTEVIIIGYHNDWLTIGLFLLGWEML